MTYMSNNEREESAKKYVGQLTPEQKLTDLRHEILRILAALEPNVALIGDIDPMKIEGLPEYYGRCVTRLIDAVKDLRNLIDIYIPVK